MKRKVLFVCVHNSARSQMAGAWTNHLCGDSIEAQSAGLEPGTLNPLAVEAMREVGIDISRSETKSVFDLYKSGALFHDIVTVCDEASGERCPVFPGVVKRYHWSFADPAAFIGTRAQQLEQMRAVRDAIKARVEVWCADITTPTSARL